MIVPSDANGCLSGRTPSDAESVDSGPAHVPPRNREQWRLAGLAGTTLVCLGLCLTLAVPFLPAITWAIALAIIAWPVHKWLGGLVKWPRLASLLSSAVVVVAIVAPTLFVCYQLAREAAGVADRVQVAGGSPVREKLAEMPLLEPVFQWMDRMDLQVEVEVRKIVGLYTQDASGLAQGSFAAIIQFLVAIFILYYLFLDRGTFLHSLRGLLPLSKAESDEVFARAADSVHANLYATLITSVLDATGGTFLFWMLGLPAPLLWGVVMFVLSILPVVGAALIWLPAVVYLALTDRWLGGLGLLAWGVLSFIFVDTILYVRLAGQRMRMHEVPALIAFLGGIAVFGLSGMILGPAILAVTTALLGVWQRRLKSNAAGPSIQREDVVATNVGVN